MLDLHNIQLVKSTYVILFTQNIKQIIIFIYLDYSTT